MKDYSHPYKTEKIKTYKKVEKYEDKKELKDEIEKLNKFYKNRLRDNVIRLKEF